MTINEKIINILEFRRLIEFELVRRVPEAHTDRESCIKATISALSCLYFYILNLKYSELRLLYIYTKKHNNRKSSEFEETFQ
jgi:hypothetical protein